MEMVTQGVDLGVVLRGNAVAGNERLRGLGFNARQVPILADIIRYALSSLVDYISLGVDYWFPFAAGEPRLLWPVTAYGLAPLNVLKHIEPP